MAKTIKQQALTLICKYGWVPNQRGTAHCDPKGRTAKQVYLGRGYSVRIGESKATSYPTTISKLESFLHSVESLPVPTIEPKQENPLTVARREWHTRIGQMDLESLQALDAPKLKVWVDGKFRPHVVSNPFELSGWEVVFIGQDCLYLCRREDAEECRIGLAMLLA